jgi:pilus assembly protein CpaB
MKRRLLAALAAIVLAGAGAVLLVGYVGHADQRAMAGMQSVNVLVVTAPVPEGTTAVALAKLVTTKALPAIAVAHGALSSLDPIGGKVATADLQPGEQLLASRFADPAALTSSGGIQIPKGFQQVSVSLEPQRALGGELTPGATVGIFLSMPKDDPYPAQTHLVLHKVLVTKVVGGSVAPASAGNKAPAASPGTAVMVTLALDSHNAENVVYGAEHGTLWLSSEPTDALLSGTRVVTRGNVNQ